MKDGINIISLLGVGYCRMVMGSMVREGHGIFVRFGTLGRGIHPNYQIRYSDGSVRTYRGRTHLPYLAAGAEFASGNLSREFGFNEIAALAS